MKLSIREIADWKEKGIVPQKLTKTHDGTSMGKIGPILDKWVKTVDSHKCSVFDENGHQLYESLSSPSGMTFELMRWNFLQNKDFVYANSTNLHYITNNEDDSTGHNVSIQETDENGKTISVTNVPNSDKLKALTTQNDDGDYLLRSFSLASPNSTRMTVIRNNKFNEENHESYQQTIKDFDKANIEYEKEFNKIVKERGTVEAVKELGTWEQAVFKGQGFDKRFEDCNTKFRITKP